MITNPWGWRIWDEARATMAEFRSGALFDAAKVEPYGDVIIKRPTDPTPPTWKRAQGQAYAPGHRSPIVAAVHASCSEMSLMKTVLYSIINHSKSLIAATTTGSLSLSSSKSASPLFLSSRGLSLAQPLSNLSSPSAYAPVIFLFDDMMYRCRVVRYTELYGALWIWNSIPGDPKSNSQETMGGIVSFYFKTILSNCFWR